MSFSPPPPPPSLATPSSAPPVDLPLRQIPGSYGWPLVGSISDRLDYFWFQKPESFFRKRIEKHKSTVFRTNVPPSFPFFLNVNPNVIAVVDVKSFSHFFDMDLVEKKDILLGDFAPSLAYTGNMRVGVYQDPSEPQHGMVKNFTMDILKRSSGIWASELVSNLDKMCDNLESTLSNSSSASYLFPLQQFLFTFLTKTLSGADPSVDAKIADGGYLMFDRWLALQLLPTVPIGILQPLEEIFLHSFAYPFFLVSGDYNNLYNFIKQHGKEVVNRGKLEFGLTEEESIHNLLFVLGFNAFGGFSVFLPSLIDAIATDTTGLQRKLAKEARENGGSTLTLNSVKDMPLINSVVYEVLRLNPPVPLQYARARKDFTLSSHDSAFRVTKGELLCGYQKLVMRDPLVFQEPESFKPDRFANDGAQLLDYLFWSNGPQSGSATSSNKQCAGKDIVPLTAALIVAHLFRRYDSIEGNSSSITALQRAK
ncbi:fatty acid hydroperoxide lyase, chloroplastic-like [Arachis duranensis]|uniref:Fatty acid hydroperoxide lyase, chloroplastic n=2 Tax=Arachis TaxID=3817 RepID=A0A6P4C238_ARADU|nr:fatty acid hydroperoxide lyase, chloroplastic [Arachis duranensis]XP_052112394.1 fatty acid hydroperoxide lyase, chloroplastic-like [Arachis duranensis]